MTDGRFTKVGTAPWGNAATVVVSTLVTHLTALVDAALAAGRPADDHVVLTLHGGSTNQVTVPCRLDEVVVAVSATEAPGADPVHVIMGVAAEQRGELSWYETKPLFGWRVLVPRTKDQAAPMVARLRTYGAHSEEVPTISVEPPRSPLQMDKAIRGLVEGRYEWIAFTSVNAVKAVREKFEEYGLDARAFSGLKVAVVGDVTAAALRGWGIEPDLVPTEEQSAAGLAAEFPPYDEVLDPINRVFLPGPTSPPRPWPPAWSSSGGRSRTSPPTAPCVPPRRPPRCARRSRPASSTRSCSPRPRPCATSSASPASRTRARSSPRSVPRRRRRARSTGCASTWWPTSRRSSRLADALAAFAADRRDAMVAAGEVVQRPSQRKAPARRV